MLQLFGFCDPLLFELSDKICSGLQFINFWQDLSRDKEIKRYYVPKDLLSENKLSLDEFYNSKELNDKHYAVVDELLKWTKENYLYGYELINHLKGRFKLEIKTTWFGGYKILEKSEKLSAKLLFERPKLSKIDFLQLFIKSIFKG